MPKLQKNEHAPLNVTKQAHHRIFCGLGWDPVEKAKFTEKLTAIIGGKKTYHDLDLSVFMYDANKFYINSICAKSDQSLEELGQVYHSGDNVEGLGDGDDEQISVELKNLSPDIQHLVFQASIKSGHSFGEILSPEIRLADGYSNHDFLQTPLNDDAGKSCSAYVFCHIYRKGLDDWKIHFIHEYVKPKAIGKWEDHLKQFLIEQ